MKLWEEGYAACPYSSYTLQLHLMVSNSFGGGGDLKKNQRPFNEFEVN